MLALCMMASILTCMRAFCIWLISLLSYCHDPSATSALLGLPPVHLVMRAGAIEIELVPVDLVHDDPGVLGRVARGGHVDAPSAGEGPDRAWPR